MSDQTQPDAADNQAKSPVPVSIQRDGDDRIVITWSDQHVSRHTAIQLRKACPCASCREKKRSGKEKDNDHRSAALPVLTAAEAKPLTIEGMRPVGTYAYSISFSDGHSSGIYPFAMLRESKTDTPG